MSLDHSYHETELSSRRYNTDRRLGPLQWLFGGLVRSWQRRCMIRAFEAMDDRLLRDIGLERGDIKDVVGSFDDRELRMVPLSPTTVAVGTGQQVYTKTA
ncbi:MAG: DUF1127 domain-containing protein [Paracoccaceae bacterium]